MDTSLEHLLHATLPDQKADTKPVSPTLLLGIGGTGKEVLLRLRRRIVERYGSLSALPFIHYLHLDTDATSSALEQYDLRAADDPLAAEIYFQPSERVGLTLEGGTGRYLSNIQTYPHIQRWFPTTGKLAGLGDLGEGAGQVRVASRLGFYHGKNFAAITSSLDQARRKLTDTTIVDRVGQLGFDLDATRMDVFVVCSIAGGTGGGTFLDVGFLAQRFFGNATVVGILALPSFFADYAGGNRTQANGYAALMELNHYSFGHNFLADWDGTRAEELSPPPFSVTYLVDGTNEAGLSIPSGGSEVSAYQMIADVLFQEYSLGSFAGAKRATRVNLVNFSLDVYSHNFLNEALRNKGTGGQRKVVGDTYPTRFGSFGFSAIEFPTDRLHTACSARLAMDVLAFWQKTLLEDPLERLFTAFLSHEDVRFAQGRFERRDGGGVLDRSDVEDALLVYQEAGGKTFPSFLWEKAQKVRQLLAATPKTMRSQVLEQQLDELEQVFAKDDSEDPEEWGVGVRQLESNKRRYLERVTAAIERRAEVIADDPRYGVAHTLSLLRELKLLLRNEHFRYLSYFSAAIGEWRDMTQDQGSLLDQLRLDVARHERLRLFRGALLAWDLDRLAGRDRDDELGVLYGYYYSRVMKQVAKRGKAICEVVDEFLGKDDPTGDGLLARYWGLLSGFAELQQYLERKRDYFAEPRASAQVLSLYEASDFDAWYRTWVGEGEKHRATVEAVGNQLLQEVFEVPTVTAAMKRIQQTPPEELEGHILAHCKKYFTTQEKQPEVLELLFNGRWAPEKERLVKSAYDKAKVWLEPAKTGLDHVNKPTVVSDQRPCLIGVDTDHPRHFHEFQKLIGRLRTPGDTSPSYKSLGRAHRGSILFYNELAGVPVFHSSALTRPGGMQSAYLGWKEKGELHFDKNRFQFGDVIPKTTQQAQTFANSVRAFVLARVLGLLQVRELKNESDQPIFYYSYARRVASTRDTVNLGTEDEAIDALYRDQRPENETDRSQLLEAIEAAIQRLRDEQLLWVYALLLDFYIYQVYPTQRTDRWTDEVTILQYSPQHAVLAGARDQLAASLPSEADRHRLFTLVEAKRRGKQAEAMSYDDYVEALGSHVRFEGRFRGDTEGMVFERPSYHRTPVLDVGRLRTEKVPVAPKPPKDPSPPSPHGKRPCPNCTQEIDVRAVFCPHCRQTVAKHSICPQCGEERVPDDLEKCWRCHSPLHVGSKIECPECLAWSGYADEFPCNVCGYDPSAPKRPSEPAVAPPPSGSASRKGTSPPPLAPEPPPPAEAPAEPETAPEGAKEELIECPTCFSRVPPGPKCPICDGLLNSSR